MPKKEERDKTKKNLIGKYVYFCTYEILDKEKQIKRVCWDVFSSIREERTTAEILLLEDLLEEIYQNKLKSEHEEVRIISLSLICDKTRIVSEQTNFVVTYGSLLAATGEEKIENKAFSTGEALYSEERVKDFVKAFFQSLPYSSETRYIVSLNQAIER